MKDWARVPKGPADDVDGALAVQAQGVDTREVRELGGDPQALLSWARWPQQHGLVASIRHDSAEDSEGSLLAAAGAGLFPKAGSFSLDLHGTTSPCLTTAHYEWRDYRIRLAEAADVPALQSLELRCWPSTRRVPENGWA